MLNFGALLKYDIKALGRILTPIYGVALALVIIMAVVLNAFGDNEEFMDKFGWLIEPMPGWVAFFAIGAVIATTIIFIIGRFTKNLLGNEGYLSMTLPVSINTHLSSKTIAATIWTAIGIIVAFAIGFIAFITPSDFIYETKLIFDIEEGYRLRFYMTALEILLAGLIGIAEAIVKIYAAISIGQRWTSHKLLGSVIAYGGFVIIEGVAALILDESGATPFFFMGSDASDLVNFQVGLAITCVCAIILGAIYWLVANRMLTKHLNLD